VCTIENEVAFRALNDRIRELESDWHSSDPMAFVCECSSPGCTAAVYLTTGEYGEVRAHPDHFLTLPHHVRPEEERIVSSNDRYAVVEKLEPAGPDEEDALAPPTTWA
jgi:hypothetical protein